MTRGVRICLVALAGGWGLAQPVCGQAVRGHVLEAGTDRPVAGAVVVLLDEAGEPVAGFRTDSTGQFRLDAPEMGRYRIRAERIGFRGEVSAPLELSGDRESVVEVRLEGGPIALDSLVVEVAPASFLEATGFYERKQAGIGHFLTRPEIEAKEPRRLSDLFGDVPGVRVVYGRGGKADLVLRGAVDLGGLMRGGSGLCLPAVVLDGLLVRSRGSRKAADLALDEVVLPADVEAIELYRGPAEVPVRFSGTDRVCGVVVIWTRR